MFSILKKIKKMIGNVKDKLLKIQEKFLRGISSFMKKLRKRKIRKFNTNPNIVNKNIDTSNNKDYSMCNSDNCFKFLNYDSVIELAQLVFTIKKYLNRLFQNSEIESKGRALKSNILKLENFLKDNGIEIIDDTGKEYNDGMNINIVDEIKVENGNDSCKKVIHDVLSPSIIIRKGNKIELKKGRCVLKQVPIEEAKEFLNENNEKINDEVKKC